MAVADVKVLELLKEGKKSTSRIAGQLGYDYNSTLRVLNNLKKIGKIKSEKKLKFTYWSINE